MSEPTADATVSKGEFARLANVTPGRVSQWIAAGQIGQDALVGEGRYARINVQRAKAQLRLKLDVGQRFGNGLDTRLDSAALPSDLGRDPLRPQLDPIEEQIKREKLSALQAANRKSAEEELARRGLYVRSDDVQATMTKLAVSMLNVWEGALPDLANAVSAKFELPHRDVLHILRHEARSVREKAAAEASKRAASAPELLAHEVADATDQAMGQA